MGRNPEGFQPGHSQSQTLPEAPRVTTGACSYAARKSACHRLIVHKESQLATMLEQSAPQDEDSNPFTLGRSLDRPGD